MAYPSLCGVNAFESQQYIRFDRMWANGLATIQQPLFLSSLGGDYDDDKELVVIGDFSLKRGAKFPYLMHGGVCPVQYKSDEISWQADEVDYFGDETAHMGDEIISNPASEILW